MGWTEISLLKTDTQLCSVLACSKTLASSRITLRCAHRLNIKLIIKSKMAERSNAVAAPGPKDSAFMSFNVVCSSQNIVDLPPIHKEFFPEHIYDRQSLLDIGNAYKHQLSLEAAEKLQGLCLLRKPNLETAASPTDATRTRRVASGVREDGSAVSAEVYELG